MAALLVAFLNRNFFSFCFRSSSIEHTFKFCAWMDVTIVAKWGEERERERGRREEEGGKRNEREGGRKKGMREKEGGGGRREREGREKG